MTDTPHSRADEIRPYDERVPLGSTGLGEDAAPGSGDEREGSCLSEFLDCTRLWREEIDTCLGGGAAGELAARASMRKAESTVHVAIEGGKVPAGEAGVPAMLRMLEGTLYDSIRIVEHDWEKGWLLVEASGGVESRAHLRQGGPVEHAVCDMLRGFVAGAYLYLRRRAGLPADDVRAVEVTCAAQGHPQCRFAAGSAEALAAHGLSAPAFDLTSRRELEESLRRSRESESSFQKFVEGMPFGLVEIDTDGRITFANHKVLELIGSPLRRLRGTHFSANIHPEDRELVQAEFQKVVDGRADPYPVQCRLVRADGTARPCAVDAFPVRDARDRVVGYQGLIVDLADRVHLGVSAQRFHEGLRESSRPFLELEPEGRVRYANGAALELLGAQAEEVIGEPFDRFIAGDGSSEAYRTFLEVAAGRVKSAVGRWEIARQDDSRRDAQLHFIADGLKIGKVERVLVLAEDVGGREGAGATEEERRLHYMVSAGPAVIYACEPDGDYGATFVSDNVVAQLGYEPREFTEEPKFWASRIHPDDAPRVFADLPKLSEVGHHTHEYRFLHKDGSYRWMRDELRLLRDAQGNAVEIVGSWTDITDRKRGEEALRESEEKWRSLAENAPSIIVTVARDGTIQYLNRTVSGVDMEQTLGKKIYDYVEPEDRDMVREVVEGVFETGQPGSYMIRGVGPDGRTSSYETRIGPVKRDGRVIAAMFVTTDITDRKRGEEALRESEEKWRSLAEHAPSIIITAARDGTIDYINRTVRGLTVEGTLGKTLYDFIEPEYHDVVREATERVFDTGRPASYEIRGVGPDGRTSWYSTQVGPLMRDGEVVATTHITTDITERKQVEEALLYKNALLEAQHETSLDGMLVVDAEAHTVSWNGRFAKMWRMSPELLARRDDDAMLDFVLGQLKDPEGFIRRVRYLYAHKDEKSEDQIAFKDGRVFHRYSSPLLDSHGTYHGRVWYFRDITERKQAEEALRQSEERFKAVFDNATDGIVVADIEERRFHIANKRFCEMLSCEPEDITTLGVADIHPEKDLPHVTQQFEKQLRGEITLARDIPVRRTDGTVFYADINASRVTLAGRTYLMGIFRDVTEHKHAEESLRESEELHRTLMNALPDAVTMSDLDGRITYASERTLEVHGYESAEGLLGESSFELIAPEDRERAMINLQETLKEGAVKDMEYSLLRKDGTRFPAEVSAAVVPDAHGEPKALVAITHDITERRRKEQELREIEGKREELALEVAALRSEMQGRYGPDSIIGRDPKMRAIYETILAVSRTNATVLVQGETGTGKELVAKAVHYNSSRREKPFVKVDCGALAENLLESELFGHVKGAFTGAVRDHAGRFEVAADATIFLDEIHNLSMPLQAKLLRVVQEGRFEKVGGTKTIEVDVRIVAATNEDLEALVARGGFRKDLYYRVNVIPIKVPPLRDRRGDVPLLVVAFIQRFAERHEKKVTGVSKEALEKFVGYDWPGNVRELENIVEQAVVFSRGRTIQAEDVRLPEAGPAPRDGPSFGESPQSLRKALEDPEKRAILDALERTGGNKKKAAGILRISRSALYEKLKRHGIPTKK